MKWLPARIGENCVQGVVIAEVQQGAYVIRKIPKRADCSSVIKSKIKEKEIVRLNTPYELASVLLPIVAPGEEVVDRYTFIGSTVLSQALEIWDALKVMSQVMVIGEE